MDLSQYKKTLQTIVQPRTLGFLINDKQILLGVKKKGFGKGYYLGIGGKVEGNETIKQAAIREIKEEIGVKATNLQKQATLNFYFPHIIDESWNQQVHAFLVTAWEGEPQESEEIKPEWFFKNKLPCDNMWDDAHYWLPQVLEGEYREADFMFNEDLKVVEHTL